MITRIPLDLANSRVATLHRHDHRGRVVEVNQWDGGTPARFTLMRTADDVICRFRADVPDDLARTLEELCSQEPRGQDLEKLPVHHHRYRTLLSSHAPVEAVSAGPVYIFTQDVAGSVAPIAIGERNAYLLRGGLEEWIPDVPHRKPFMAMVDDGHAVAVCASVRISAAVHCAGVETRPEYRHRGHAVNAAGGWGRAVRALGATPFYSTSWENIASQRVAQRLGLTMVALDFSIA
jgi:GNAT acetyltransferase